MFQIENSPPLSGLFLTMISLPEYTKCLNSVSVTQLLCLIECKPVDKWNVDRLSASAEKGYKSVKKNRCQSCLCYYSLGNSALWIHREPQAAESASSVLHNLIKTTAR